MNSNCNHNNVITDYHEGTVICLECSFVIENQVFVYEQQTTETSTDISTRDYKEILNRLNCSYDILQNNQINDIPDLYNVINKTNSISLKEFCAATGYNTKEIVKKNKETVSCQDFDNLLEKYCKVFDLGYKNYTVIKEKIRQKPYSGHPPLTVIGYHIYVFVKTELKKKITIKDICSNLGISSISIQRYRKYELSFRS